MPKLHRTHLSVLFLLFSGIAAAQSGSQSTAQVSSRDEQKAALKFAGDVGRGKKFEHDIGHGLVFQLTPDADAPDSGWTIEIVPKSRGSSNEDEFSAIATPPYHFSISAISTRLTARLPRSLSEFRPVDLISCSLPKMPAPH